MNVLLDSSSSQKKKYKYKKELKKQNNNKILLPSEKEISAPLYFIFFFTFREFHSKSYDERTTNSSMHTNLSRKTPKKRQFQRAIWECDRRKRKVSQKIFHHLEIGLRQNQRQNQGAAEAHPLLEGTRVPWNGRTAGGAENWPRRWMECACLE